MNRIGRTFSIIAMTGVLAGIPEIANGIIPEKEAGKSVYLGDVFTDGKIDASDASKVLGEYSSISVGKGTTLTEEEAEVADVNGDKSVDASDASLILAYYSDISTGGYISLEEFIKDLME